MAYQSNLLGDFWQGYRQKRIGTGRGLSKKEIGGLLGPMLEYDAQRAADANRMAQAQANTDRMYSLQEKSQDNQLMAQMVGGVGQLAQVPMAIKAGRNLLGGTPKPTPADATAPAVTTAQGGVVPEAAVGTTAQGATVPMAAATPATPAPVTYGAAGDMGAGLSTTTTAAAPTAGSSMLSAAGPAAALYSAQLASSPYVDRVVGDKWNMKNTATGWKYGGVPGAQIGAMVDVGDKIIKGAEHFFKNMF